MTRGSVVVALLIACFAGGAEGQTDPLDCGHVELEGRRMFACTGGQSGPTVVFEAGMRDDHRAWTAVAPAVARFAHVVTYDRAGSGASDAAEPPRTPSAIAGDLRGLLHTLQAEPPYLLVAHSAGGWHVRAFAERFPDEIAGLILLDSPHEAFEDRRLALMDEAERQARAQAVARSRAGVSEAVRQEYEGIDAERAMFGGLPDVPLLVVTAAWHRWGDTPHASAFEAAWQDLQARLAALAPNGRLLVVEGVGHQIPRERPTLVTDLIAEMLGVER